MHQWKYLCLQCSTQNNCSQFRILFSRQCWSEELFLGRVYRIDKWVLRWYVLFLDDLIKRMQWYSFVIGFTLTCGRVQFEEPKRFENMFAMYITVSQQTCTLNNQNVFSKIWTLAGYCTFAINFVSWRNSRRECLAGSGEAGKDESGFRTSIFHYVTVDPEARASKFCNDLPGPPRGGTGGANAQGPGDF